MRPVLVATCLVAALLAMPATASGAGGPAPPQQGGAGVTVPGGPDRFVAVAAGRDTLVQRVRVDGGVVERSRLLRGRLGIPGAAYDGATTGLSADGRTLVLAPLRYQARRTRLMVLETRRLRPLASVTLAGAYAVDAISPDGRWLYLIHSLDPNDPLHYEVRAYDLRERRLLPGAIVDTREPDEEMAGIPISRASGPGGRWAYTLYQRPQGEAFIHALDTSTRRARCIDLPTLTGDISGERLRVADGGARLVVFSAAGPQLEVDTARFAVRPPSSPDSRPAPAAANAGGDPVWVLALLPLAALAGLAVTLRRRHRHTPAA